MGNLKTGVGGSGTPLPVMLWGLQLKARKGLHSVTPTEAVKGSLGSRLFQLFVAALPSPQVPCLLTAHDQPPGGFPSIFQSRV